MEKTNKSENMRYKRNDEFIESDIIELMQYVYTTH